MAHTVFLALGTNVGDRLSNLIAAREALPPAVKALASSSVFQTPPWGYTDQPEFLNQVIQAETELSPHGLLSYLKEIEEDLGRQKTFRYGPRLIDIDILFYEDRIVQRGDLKIPHPRLHERAFVLVPLAELAPKLQHPELKRSIQDLLTQVDRSGIERYPAPGPAGKDRQEDTPRAREGNEET
jgi:2-amino-4-hydroxy-6-hydroxymethyldihydropteridine diphosphokinase